MSLQNVGLLPFVLGIFLFQKFNKHRTAQMKFESHFYQIFKLH